MKAEHRHELKTNELADWMAHFPQWAKNNISTIAVVLAVIIGAVGLYAWRNYHAKTAGEEHMRFTMLSNQVSGNIAKVLQAHAQNKDLSFMLLQADESLQTFANTTKDNKMAALALIKRAEALRAELHYRMQNITQQDINEQISKAEDSYNKALERAASDPMLTGIAQYGLGLCAEERGNFDKARQIYEGILKKPDFEPTITFARAKYRLAVMKEFEQKITFQPAPASAKPSIPPQLTLPDSIKLPNVGPLDINRPVDSNKPAEIKESPVIDKPVSANEPAPVAAPIDVNSNSSLPTEVENPTEAPIPQDPNNNVATAPDANATGK